jgi:two-component system phosphate regulon sensor histidine kinase PhoR
MNVSTWLILLLGVLVIVLFIILRRVVVKLNDRNFEMHPLRSDLSRMKYQLQHQQDQNLTLADSAFDALLVIDTDHRVRLINQTARDLFSAKDQTVGQTLMSVVRNHELDAFAEGVLRGDNVFETQIEVGERTFRVRGGLIPGIGRPTMALALQDISELLRLTRARREMVANFSHDLGTPISSIRLLVETLTQSLGRNPERDLERLNKVAAEIDSLQHIRQELMDLSMIESGKAIIRMVPVNVGDILNEAFAIMGTQIEGKKLELINQIPDDVRVLVDPEQTRRVIMNVIHNAVKFTPQGGQIIFTASRANQMATIRIRDSGPGIPPQDRTRIFERFYQVDTARTGQPGGGSGLGLSIAKHIIEAQGGKIWAEAGIPKGACICFTLPLAESAKASS